LKEKVGNQKNTGKYEKKCVRKRKSDSGKPIVLQLVEEWRKQKRKGIEIKRESLSEIKERRNSKVGVREITKLRNW
jgi:hypothetical protein